MLPTRLLLSLSAAVLAGGAFATGDLTAQQPIEVKVQLGDKDNGLRFVPNQLQFETGRLYKLVLHNAGGLAHYFSSEGFARSVFTRKVQVLGKDGKTIAEVKGSIAEIDVLPGGTAEWWFVPIKTATLSDLKCTVEGHAAGGMTGTISIK